MKIELLIVVLLTVCNECKGGIIDGLLGGVKDIHSKIHGVAGNVIGGITHHKLDFHAGGGITTGHGQPENPVSGYPNGEGQKKPVDTVIVVVEDHRGPNYGQKPNYGQNSNYGQNPNYGQGPNYGHHHQQDRYPPGNEPGYDQSNYGNNRPNYGNQRPGYGDQGSQPGYGNNQPGYDNERPGYGVNQPGYEDNNRPNYGNNRPSYGNNRPSYGNDRPGYGNNRPGYGNRPEDNIQPNNQPDLGDDVQKPNQDGHDLDQTTEYVKTNPVGNENGVNKPSSDGPLFVPLDHNQNDPTEGKDPKRETNQDKKPVDIDGDEDFGIDIRFKDE